MTSVTPRYCHLRFTLLVAALFIGQRSSWAQPADGSSQNKDESRQTENPKKGNPFDIEFPNGVKVEFVGLAKMTADQEDAKSWWKPDGSPLGFAPKYWGGGAFGGDLEYVRTVFHVRGVNDTNAVSVALASSSNHEVSRKEGGPLIANYGLVDIPRDKSTMTFVIGAATEPRSTVRFMDVNGKRLPRRVDAPPDPIQEDITIERIGDVTFSLDTVDGRTRFIEPGDRISTESTQVTCRIPGEWEKVDLQMAAIDKEGNSYSDGFAVFTVFLEPSDKSNNTVRFAKVFTLPISEIDHFEYQFRLFRNWVTYENVSLQPGKTDVKVSSRSGPKANVATVTEENVSDPVPIKADARKPEVPLSERKGIALMGKIDFDSDGKSDRDRLHQKINAAGFVIDDEIDGEGNPLIQDGEIRQSTRYFVIGTFDSFKDDQDRVRVTEQLGRMRHDARKHGVRTMKLADFVPFINRLNNTDKYANLLTALFKEPSVELLTQLLEGTETKQPEIVKLIDNGYDSKGSPLKLIDTGTQQYAVVSALVKPVVNPSGRVITDHSRLPQCSFVFDVNGVHVASIGGQMEKTVDQSPDQIDVLSLGPKEDWFVRITRFEKNPPFDHVTEYHRIREPMVKSLRILHYPNSSPWSFGPEPITRYGTLYFDFPMVKDKLEGGTATTPTNVTVHPFIHWDGDRNCFFGNSELIAKGKPLYKVEVGWSADFQELSLRSDQLVVSGGVRKDDGYHNWQTVVPEGLEAVITLSIPQSYGPAKLIQKTLEPGPANVCLQIKPGIDPAVRLIYEGKTESFQLPGEPDEIPIVQPPTIQVLNPNESAKLYHRPVEEVKDEITFEIKLVKAVK